jgi:alpha-N-arabinofuranosidase
MRTIVKVITLSIVLLQACGGKDQPRTGVEYGKIVNPSAEDVESSVVKGWTADNRNRDAILFYDTETAHHGTKSLMIRSGREAYGRWSTKVNLKPWSKYRFTGWIKTENIETTRGSGAGFRLDGLNVEPEGFTGTNGWTEVIYEFDTGSDDCVTLACMLDISGNAKGRVWFDNMKFDLVSTEKFSTDITVNLDTRSEPMPLYIYGQFIEHLGRCIYGGIWAEMLEDRKFWFTPGDRESPWRVTGNRDLLTMDRSYPFTGSQTPILGVNSGGVAILSQENLGFRENMTYSGRIILRSTPGITGVKVSVRIGGIEQVVSIDNLTGNYREYPLSFSSDRLVHDAVLSIEPEGTGRLWVGTVSLMPDDNIDGFRSDVMALLKELNSPVYRWPGGNFVSGYDWKDGIGDRDKRPPRKNPAWRGVESNDVGMHEFIRFCEILGTEPYIAVNAGLGYADEARQQVEYCNGSVTTPMGRRRAANGSEEPWNVKWWSVGNEMYGGWQLGHMSTEAFVEKHNEFARVMRSADSTIVLIAVGEVGPWDEMMLANCADNMEMISEHFYRQDWHGGGLMTHIKQIPDAIRQKAVAHRNYRETIPALEGRDIRICMDEWNYWYGPHIYGELGTRYFYRDAMGIAAGLNEFSRHTDIIYMANYAQTVNVIGAIKASTTHSEFDGTGQVLKMYRHRFGTVPVAIVGETRPFDIAATLTEAMDTLTISVVNPIWDEVSFPLSVNGGTPGGRMDIWRIVSPDDMAHNEPGREPSVTIVSETNVARPLKLRAGPASITIFRIPVKVN